VLLKPHLNSTCPRILTDNAEGPKQRDTRREDAIPKCYVEKECDIEMDLKEMSWNEM